MTLFYSSQPETLPLELPPGTRYQFGGSAYESGCFPDGAKLGGGCIYGGRIIRGDDSACDQALVKAEHILWRKVPVVGGEESLEPQVGETWALDASYKGTTITIRGITLGDYPFVGDNGGNFARCELVRRISSAPTPSVPEPVTVRFYEKDPGVGNYPAILGPGSRDTMSTPRDVSGWVFGAARPGFDDGYYPTHPHEGSGVCAWAVNWSTVPAPAPVVVSKRIATPEPKEDPYTSRRLETDDAAIADVMLKLDEKRAAKRRRFTADTLDGFGRNDLDRPLLKMGGRFGRVVPVTHPTTWPSVGDDEP
jgi:hypothetical protein